MNPPPDTHDGRRWSTPGWLKWGAVGALLGLPWFVIDSEANLSIFLKLDDGNIKGESTVKGHEGEIEVLAMSYAGSNSGSTHIGGGTGAGVANVQDIGLTKFIDTSSSELMRRLLTGNHIPTARFAFVEIDPLGKERPVVTLQLKEVLVNGYAPGGSGSEDRLTENVSLNFAEFTFQTFSYAADGSTSASPSITWDIVTGTSGSNTAPSISTIGSQTIVEDAGINIPFTISDSQTATGSLTLSRSTTNPVLVPLSGIVFGGSGSNRTATITPAPNASGSATIGITVTDGGGLSSIRTFTFTVTPVNDPPTIPAITNQVTDYGIPLALPLNIADIDTAATSVTVSATSGNPALIPAANITSSGTGAARVLTLSPVAGVSGSSLITLTANDGATNSAPVAFTFTVNPAGFNAPTDIQWSGSTPIVPENSATNTAVGSLVTTDPNDGNNVTYTLLDSAGGRFKLGPLGTILVDNGLLLNFENAASHPIIVRATDPATNIYDKILTVSLSNVNEAPVITAPASVNFLADSTNPVTGITLADADAGSADISITFGVPVGTLYLDDSGALAGKVSGNNTNSVTVTASTTAIQAALTAGGFVFQAATVPTGSYSLSIQANDLGNTGPGGPQNSTTTLEINIVPSQFNQWRQEYFPTQLGDLSISGPLADFDKDGIANLLEYGVGSSPTDPTDGPGLVEFIQQDVAGTLYPAVRFKRLKPDFEPSLQIQLEIATDAFNWRVDPNDVALVSTTPLDEIRDTIVIRSTLPVQGEARQMMRLRFTLVP